MNKAFVTVLNRHKMTVLFFSSASLFCKCFHFDTVQWNRSPGTLLELQSLVRLLSGCKLKFMGSGNNLNRKYKLCE